MIIEFSNKGVNDDLHKIIFCFGVLGTRMVLVDRVRRKIGKSIYRQYFWEVLLKREVEKNNTCKENWNQYKFYFCFKLEEIMAYLYSDRIDSQNYNAGERGRIARSMFFNKQEDNVCSKQEEVLALGRKLVHNTEEKAE